MIRPSLFEPAARAAVIARIRRLGPDAVARWGKLQPKQVFPHLLDGLRRALGGIPLVGPPPGRVRAFALRTLFIHLLPWPEGKVKSSPGAFSTAPTSWEADREALIAKIEAFASARPEELSQLHPVFGAMAPKDWGVLMYRHCDHHLRQFGQ